MRVGQFLSDALSTFAGRFHMWQILELGIPVLDVLLIRPGGRDEGNVIGATDPAGRNGLRTIAPRSGKAVIAIDDVVTSRRDFGQQYRTRQIRGTDGFFIQMRGAIGGKFRDRDEFDGESFRASVDKREKSSDVELEHSVPVVFVPRFGRTGLKAFVTFELGRNASLVGATLRLERVYRLDHEGSPGCQTRISSPAHCSHHAPLRWII